MLELEGMKMSGEKVILRDWRASDLIWLEEKLNGNADWLPNEAPWLIENYDCKSELESLKSLVAEAGETKPRTCLIIAEKENDTAIGFVSSYWRNKKTNWLRVGIRILESSQRGKGFGFEAIKLWIDYNFLHRADLPRIGFTTWSGNIAMVKMAGSLGFVREACHRKAVSFNNIRFDALGFGILREEWSQSLNRAL